MVFKDRKEAGELLAQAILRKYDSTLKNPVIVAIPRGGVVVAEPIAEILNAPIELVIPRKIGAPFNEEFAIAAVTEDGYVLMNPSVTDEIAYRLGISKDYIERKTLEEIEEIKRRKEKYLQGKTKVNLQEKDTILVDDGIATGLTVKAAIMSLRRENPRRIILAVPVMPADKVSEFQQLVDDLIVLYAPEFFNAVGQFYQSFPQTTDEEVIEIMEKFHP
ncbi:phosphoribosyltransferase [Desulfurobacterium thermolithotrophum DSM 11699]|uniref:Phosphoribosyltransferase n=1 Tax=Desulfurobacterium thermolithotrophum (strain DSM 11699 / BSA) TaxID=868864 RepID=F0S1Y1_DESTD|nr:phosphoribosyltransferase family protein [Desulfurobacterium thermolithotrophum]ADY74062.1 phosphoribosyltransferase [Desulfurobacterium thermolithotrophum DSM 11699]